MSSFIISWQIQELLQFHLSAGTFTIFKLIIYNVIAQHNGLENTIMKGIFLGLWEWEWLRRYLWQFKHHSDWSGNPGYTMRHFQNGYEDRKVLHWTSPIKMIIHKVLLRERKCFRFHCTRTQHQCDKVPGECTMKVQKCDSRSCTSTMTTERLEHATGFHSFTCNSSSSQLSLVCLNFWCSHVNSTFTLLLYMWLCASPLCSSYFHKKQAA